MPAVVLLAAGASRRFRSPKLLADVDGRSLVQRAADACLASSCRPVVVVLGAYREKIEPTLPAGTNVVFNAKWSEGMGTSIAAGIAALPHDVGAAIIAVADQPSLQGKVLDELAMCSAEKPGCIVACDDGVAVGPPVLFPREFFPELVALQGDTGARRVLEEHGERTQIFRVRRMQDIDTPENYRDYLAAPPERDA